jgi:hypothetical protein
MSELQPRFELRAFARNFGIVEEKLRRLSGCEQIRESAETYIMSSANNENNTKIRDDKMDIKVLVQVKQGLEQWSPRMKGIFPMDAHTLRNEVFPAFAAKPPPFNRSQYALSQFLQELIRPHPDLVAVRVFKRRFAYVVNGCMCEHAEVWVNGAGIQTVAVESMDVEAMLEAKRLLSLEEYENVNYLLAIKRIIGMEQLPGT